MKSKEENENLLFDTSSITPEEKNETIIDEKNIEETKKGIEITSKPEDQASTEQGGAQEVTQGATKNATEEKPEEPTKLDKDVEQTIYKPEEKHQEITGETEQQKKERKEGSGRKKLPRDKDGNIIREPAPATPVKKADGKEDLNKLLDQYADKTQPAPAAGTPAVVPSPVKVQMDVSKFINGAVFLIVMDAVFPSFILFLMEFMNPKYAHVKESARKKLKLDKEEKDLLEEGANEVVKYIFADANPIFVFVFSLSFIYYGKVDALEDTDFNKPVTKPISTPLTNARK